MAPLRIVFRRAASADMDQINALYALVDDGRLVARFWSSVDEAVGRVAVYPESCSIYYRQTRRVLVNTFPYWVLYRMRRDSIEVLAVVHVKRNPKFLKQKSE